MEDQKDISKQGYKDNSPYKDKPYLDIHTPSGIIDMTNVSIPLLANNVVLGPRSGLHKFDIDMVREIPLAQKGSEVTNPLNWSDEEAVSFYENNIGNKDLWGTAELYNPTPDRIRKTVNFKQNNKLWNSFSKYIPRILTPSVDEAFQTVLTPQALMTEGIEAIRGEPYNFSNALPTFTSEQEEKEGLPTSTQRLPSETYASEWSPGWQTVADIGFDPLIAGPIVYKGVSLLSNANKVRKLNQGFVKAMDKAQPIFTQKPIVPIERKVTSDFSDFSKVESPFIKEQHASANWDNAVKNAVGKTDNIPLVRVQNKEGLSFKNGKLVKSNKPHPIGDEGVYKTRNTTHFASGHVGQNNTSSWMDTKVALITNMDDARKSGVLNGMSPTDTWFYNKGDFVFPDNTIILTRDKVFYNQAKKANYNNIKYVGDDIDKLVEKEIKRLKTLKGDEAISIINGSRTNPVAEFMPFDVFGSTLPNWINTPSKAKKYLKEATWNDTVFSEYMKLPNGRYMSRFSSRGKDMNGNVVGGMEMITKEGKLTDEVIDAIVNGAEKNAGSYRNGIFQQMVNEAAGNSYNANSYLIRHPSHKARYINKEFQTAEEIGQDWTNYYNKLTDAERSSFNSGFPEGPMTFDPSRHTAAHSNSYMSFHEQGKPNYIPGKNAPSIYEMNSLPLNVRINEITKFERSGLRSKEWIDDQIRMMEEGTGKTWDELINLPEYINMKKYGGSVKQSPYDKEKLALKNQDGIIADMMHNGAFLPKFEMGAEKNIETPKGNYTIKKDFDKSRGLPYINYFHKDIEDRVYYDKDDKDDSGNFQIIDIAQQIYDQKRAHELTKALIKRYKSGEELSYSAMMHLSSLGVIPKDKIKDPKIETLKKAPPAPQEIRFEDLNVSSNIKNVTLGDDKIVPIDDQIALYMAHVSGISKGTPYEKKLKRIYDKLNRVYYKDSKNAGLDVIEYMKSLTES